MDPDKISRRTVLIGGAVGVACGSATLDPLFPDILEIDEMATSVRLGTPISLTASGTLHAGSVAGVNADALVSPYGLPMEIHEIKWLLSAPTNTIIGAGVGCYFELGDYKITNGYVPINAFCRSILLAQNVTTAGQVHAGDFVDYSMNSSNGEEITTTPSYANFVWRLKTPIFVPAGAVLLPKFEHRNLIPDDITVQVVYSGTVLPANYRPKKLTLPWVAYWAVDGVAYNTASSQASLESDLANPYATPLNVQRFVGRINYSGNITSVPPSERFATALSLPGNGLAEMAAKYFTIRMTHSSGANIIQSPTKFESVFYSGTRAWDVNVDIPAKSYFVVQLDKIADATASGATAALRFQPIVGMVGYREVVA
jgi:hypothetical protein